MLVYPDPIRRQAVISTVARDFPGLSREVVERIHDHLVDLNGSEPCAMELHDYVAEMAAALDEDDLRVILDLPPRPALVGRPLARIVPIDRSTQPARDRGPGRPGWTREEFWARWLDACSRTTPPFSPRSVAGHFDTLDGNRGTDPDYVRKLVRRFGLPRD